MNLNLKMIDVGAKNNVAEEALHDSQKDARKVELRLLVVARLNLGEPLILLLDCVVLEMLEQNDDLVLVEGVSDAFALCLPDVVCLGVQE